MLNDANQKHETPSAAPESRWTEAKNQRRFELIEKEVTGTLSEPERAELQKLQQEVDAYLEQEAPRPLEQLEAVKRKLQQGMRDAKASHFRKHCESSQTAASGLSTPMAAP